MAVTVPPQCAAVAGEVSRLEQEQALVRGDLAEPGLPAFAKRMLQRELAQLTSELTAKQAELNACVQQYQPPLPDLLAQTVILHVNHDTKELSVSTVTTNIGRGNASGPFEIDVAVTLTLGGETTEFFQTFEVPSTTTLWGQPVFEPDVATQMEVIAPGSGISIFNREYVTPPMIVPLYYRDGDPSGSYVFEFLVDAEDMVAETSKTNNSFRADWWTTTPGAARRDKPVVIQSGALAGAQ